MNENNSPDKSKLRSLGKFALPALMVLLCVGLYLFTGPLKPAAEGTEADAQTGAQESAAEPSARQRSSEGKSRGLPEGELELNYAHEFFRAAEEAGFADACLEKATSLRQRDYGIAWEGGEASLSLSLEDGCVTAFTLIVPLLPQAEESDPGDSLIRGDMLEAERQKHAAEKMWVLGTAEAFLRGLDGKERLTAADRDAFLLLIKSTINDGKQADATLSGMELTVELSHAAKLDMLHISASTLKDY